LEQKQYNNKYNSVEEMIHMSENRTYGICRWRKFMRQIIMYASINMDDNGYDDIADGNNSVQLQMYLRTV
jgi:hypothetical protein